MGVSWPSGLDGAALRESISEKFGDNVLRSSTDSGLTKTRQKATRRIDALACQFSWEASQYVIFKDWFDNDLGDGAFAFDWTHPITLKSIEVRFTAPPEITPSAGVRWLVNCSLEIVN